VTGLTSAGKIYILEWEKDDPKEKGRKGTDMSPKPSEKEDEYFARMEFERKKKVEEEKHRKLREEEKKKLRDLHFMMCPKCGMELIEMDYQGIKVDKCSECEGVWLDAGELEAVAKLEKPVLECFFSVFKK
jgi:uncharacterized protein